MIRRSALVPCAVAGAILYLAAFGLLVEGGVSRTWELVVLAAALFVGGAVLLQLAAKRARADGLLDRTLRVAIPAVVALIGLGLVGFWLIGSPTGGFGLCGLCLLYLGIGQVLAEVRSWNDKPANRGVRWSKMCAAVFAVGLLVCLAVSAPIGLGIVGLALLAAPAGLTLMSEDVYDERLRLPVSGPLVALALIVAGAAGLVLLAGVPLRFVVVGGVLLFLLVGAIASNTQADVLVVVTAAALIWALIPRPVDETRTVDVSRGEPVLVSLGDSYMSGEGAKRFFKKTNEPGVNECRRSQTAYAHIVAANAGEQLAFYACSGAVAADLHEDPRWPGEPVDDTPEKGLTQVDQLKDLLGDQAVDVELVIVSIGGNDAGFADIGAACLAPRSCVELGQRWLSRLAEVATGVRAAYDAIRPVVGESVPVLAVPYPQPISEESCGDSLLEDDEHQFLNGFVAELNRAVNEAATSAGFHYLQQMEGALSGGLRICDGDEDEIGVNFLPLATVDGIADQAGNPVNWIHNFLHPNEDGHKAMARALEGWRRDNRTPEPSSGPVTPARDFEFTPMRLEAIMDPDPDDWCDGPGDDPLYCGREDEEWALTQVGLLLLFAAIPFVLFVAGCWLLWLERLLPRTRPWLEERFSPSGGYPDSAADAVQSDSST